MGKSQSSLNMGNTLNGFGEKKYLRASESGYHTPLPQTNVYISPDYEKHIHKVLGSIPEWIDPLAVNDTAKVLTGSCAVVNQVIVDRTEASTDYVAKFNFIGSGITNGSFVHYKTASKTSTPNWVDYFCIIKDGTIGVRDDFPNGAVLAGVSSGQVLQVNEKETAFDDKEEVWVWSKYSNNGKTTEGWVNKKNIIPDKVRTITFPESKYKSIKGSVEYISGKTESVTKNTITNWAAPGKGGYDKEYNKIGNYYVVAVPPKIIIEKYPDSGAVLEDDFKAYSKYIKVHLKLKSDYKNSKEASEKIIECVLGDMKAHSFGKYPYDDKSKNGSTTVKKAEISIGNGLVQTGIKYPSVSEEANEAYVRFDTFNANIIEFCSQKVDFNYNHYSLVKVETNYEKKSRGTNYKAWLKKIRSE